MLSVNVIGGDLESALTFLRKKVVKSGLEREIKVHSHFVSRSEKRREKIRKGIRRARKRERRSGR